MLFQPPLGSTKTYAACPLAEISSSEAPTTSVFPLIATDNPNNVANVSELVSFAICTHGPGPEAPVFADIPVRATGRVGAKRRARCCPDKSEGYTRENTNTARQTKSAFRIRTSFRKA